MSCCIASVYSVCRSLCPDFVAYRFALDEDRGFEALMDGWMNG